MGKFRKLKRCVGAVVFGFRLFVPDLSKADSRQDEGFSGMPALLLLCDFAIIPAGITSDIGNLYFIAKGEQASTGWKVLGYISSAANITAGALWLLSPAAEDELGLGLGITNLALGVSNLVFTVWTSNLPERQERKLTLAPMIMPDTRGRLAVGVGLWLVDW